MHLLSKKKKSVTDEVSAINLTLNENLHAEVQKVLNKNIITDTDIERYNMSKNASLSANEFIDLMNKAFNTDINGEDIAKKELASG